MDRLKAVVRNGRLVMDEPTTYPEGTEFVILDLDVVNDEMTDKDRAELEQQLAESDEDIKAGRTLPASEVIAMLEADSLKRSKLNKPPARSPKPVAPTNGGKRTARTHRSSSKKS